MKEPQKFVPIKLMTAEQLALLPVGDVSFVWRKHPSKGQAEFAALMKLGQMPIEFELSLDDFLLLSVEHKWPDIHLATPEIVETRYQLYKGPRKTGAGKGTDFYKIDLILTERRLIAEYWLPQKRIDYVREIPELDEQFVRKE